MKMLLSIEDVLRRLMGYQAAQIYETFPNKWLAAKGQILSIFHSV
jgi:hypothetical protein